MNDTAFLTRPGRTDSILTLLVILSCAMVFGVAWYGSRAPEEKAQTRIVHG